MVTSFVLALALSKTGVLSGRVTLGPLTRAERQAHHTHFDKAESVEGFDLQVYRLTHRKETGDPVEDMSLGADGTFKFNLAPGPYEVTITREMHAGAFSVYPTERVRVRVNRTTSLKLHIRSEYID